MMNNLQVNTKQNNTISVSAYGEILDFSNIAENLSKDKLKEIGHLVVNEFEADKDSRQDWIDMANDWFKDFAGILKTKSNPWPGCSNVFIPSFTIPCLQFYARAYDQLVPSKEIAKCISVDGKTKDTAKRVEKYLNYQLTRKMKNWKAEMGRTQLVLPITGSAVKKTYYDYSSKQTESILLQYDEFVADYNVINLNDAKRKSHIFYLYIDDIRKKIKTGEYLDIEKYLNPESEIEDISGTKTVKETINKITETTETEAPRMFIEQHRGLDLDEDGINEPYIVTVDYKTSEVVNIQYRAYYDYTSDTIKELNYFTPYNFIPNPMSWMGFGFGHLLSSLTKAQKAILDQLIDSGTLANFKGKSGLIKKRSMVNKGEIEIELGKFNSIDIGSVDDIRKAIYTYDFKEPSMVLYNVLGLLLNFSKEISSVSDALLGKLPPSDTTATTMLAVMEQGMKLFSIIHKREHEALAEELEKIFILNSFYLDEKEYFYVQDETSMEMVSYTIGKMDFINKFDIFPASDPNITSSVERLTRAKMQYEMSLQNPLVINNPALLAEVTINYYRAMDMPNMKKISEIIYQSIEPEEPPDLSPIEEESNFLMEKPVAVIPKQDHSMHLISHRKFENSDYGKNMTPQGRKLYDSHIKEHIAMEYMKLKLAEQNLINKTIGMQ